MSAYSRVFGVLFFLVGLYSGVAVAEDGAGQIEGCLKNPVSGCFLETAQKRFAELNNEYNSYTTTRSVVGKYCSAGNERSYSLLKYYYSFQFLFELFESEDYEYLKEAIMNQEARRHLAGSLGEMSLRFSDTDLADPDHFWPRYKEIVLSNKDMVDAKTLAFERKNEIPDYVIKQARADAKYGMLLEMIYGPYIFLKTGDYP